MNRKLSKLDPLSETVKSLAKEASTLLTYKQKAAWLEKKGTLLRRNKHGKKILCEVVARLHWPFSEEAVEHMLGGKTRRIGKAFDVTPTFRELRQDKSDWPTIQWYCKKIGLRFVDNKCKCPFHRGKTHTTFVIDPKANRWRCFGECDRGGDVLDLHMFRFGLTDARKAKRDLLSRRWLGRDNVLFFSLNGSNDKTGKVTVAVKPSRVDAALVQQAEAAWQRVNIGYCKRKSMVKNPTAADFATLWLSILHADDLPIVFYHLKQAHVGELARQKLRHNAYDLQYLCCSIANNDWQGTRNLKERIFIDVEFDNWLVERQLRLLWHLKADRGWQLVSITDARNKSYHGLFYVRGMGEQAVADMIAYAARLGADPRPMRSHQPVRFPGGYRPEKGNDGRQTILYLHSDLPILTTDNKIRKKSSHPRLKDG